MKKLDEKKIVIIQYVTIFVLSFLVYSNTLRNKFALDDTMVLTENKFTKGGWEGLKKIIKTDAFEGFLGENKNLLPGGRYRPLSQLVFNVEYKLFFLNAFNYHLVNVLLFSVLMLLLFQVLNLMLKQLKFTTKLFSVAFITTLITAMHPIHTEVVANIKSLDLLLALLFVLVIIKQSLLYIDDHKKHRLAFVFLAFFFGMFSKENVVTLLAAIPLILIYFRKPKMKELFMVIGSILIGLGIYVAIRFSFLGNPPDVKVTELLNDPFLEATGNQRFATVIFTWFVYFKLILFPLKLTHDYYPYVIGLKNLTNPIVLISILVLIAGTIFSIINFIKQLKPESKPNFYAFGFMFFFIVFSASSNLLINIGAFMNERFVFIADIGLFLLAAWFLFEELPIRFPKLPRNLPITIISIVFILFSIKVISRNIAWYDDYTLFTTDAKVSFNSAKCNVSAGGKSYEKALEETNPTKKTKLLYDAVGYLNQGISIHPKYFQAYWLLGNVYFEMSLFLESFQTYKNGLMISQNQDVINNIKNLAFKAKKEGKYSDALEILTYLKAMGYKVEYDYNIADIYMLQNRLDTAISILNNAIKVEPKFEESYNKLGEIYGKYKNDFALSRLYLLKAFEINPKNTSVLENLGVLNGTIGNYSESLNFFKKALELKPNDKQLLTNISVSYRALKDIKNAELYLKLANQVPVTN